MINHITLIFQISGKISHERSQKFLLTSTPNIIQSVKAEIATISGNFPHHIKRNPRTILL